ncbi:MAG: permease-like cell division protein FtsX [Solobacterium sp.]|nr:permease-like cell division protein FtsX [Solobacterium sp.]MCH4222771.1 permease-like cell division protein FtsX [Solobacterium sp.]MCH4265980.1 permease-like cell division protein FtsX [Solobacterium sp.]
MISRFFRPLREGFRGVFRHWAMSFSSAVAVTITLLIISLFMMFTMNMRQFTGQLESSVQISVLIDYNSEDVSKEDEIGLAIQNIDGVKSVTYSSKDDEFQYYLDSFSDEKTKEAFEPFKDDNPMHDAYYVEVTDGTQLESISQQIETIDGVYKVNYGGTSAVQLISALKTIRIVGAVLALALSLLTIFLIQNTIKLTILARADEIAIMRNVGAKNGFIRSPFVVEGAIIGALGAIIPIAATYYCYTYIYNWTGGYVISKMFTLISPFPFVWYVSAALLVLGMLVGLIGSFCSVTKYLRWKR